MTPNPTPMPGTAGPWTVEVEAEPDEEQAAVYVCSERTECDATVVATMGCALSIPQEQKEQDAAYIVWACNNAQALLALLREARANIAHPMLPGAELLCRIDDALTTAGGRDG